MFSPSSYLCLFICLFVHHLTHNFHLITSTCICEQIFFSLGRCFGFGNILLGNEHVFVSPAKQKRDICTAFPASSSSSAAASSAA